MRAEAMVTALDEGTLLGMERVGDAAAVGDRELVTLAPTLLAVARYLVRSEADAADLVHGWVINLSPRGCTSDLPRGSMEPGRTYDDHCAPSPSSLRLTAEPQSKRALGDRGKDSQRLIGHKDDLRLRGPLARPGPPARPCLHVR
jgi:hypothetical protein